MAYSPEFETEKAVYRLFLNDHLKPTREDILTRERLVSLEGIVLEVTGDSIIHNPPENVFKLTSHSHVIKVAESLAADSPPVFVVDVHMDSLLRDVLPDAAAALMGAVLAGWGVSDLVALSRTQHTRRAFIKRALKGLAKCAMGFPFGTYDKAAMLLLGNVKGEIGDGHPLSLDYFDMFVPDMVIGRDAIYARILEEGVVPLILERKHGAASTSTGKSSSKVKLDIHCGAGHKRILELIQNKKQRDTILEDYARENYSVFDERYMHVFYEFRYDPEARNWDKREYDIDLFRHSL